MPEGDTIHKIAAAIAPRLVGRGLVDGSVRGESGLALAGRRVTAVEARGKHLFMTFVGSLDRAIDGSLDAALDETLDAALDGALDGELDAEIDRGLDEPLDGALDGAIEGALDIRPDGALELRSHLGMHGSWHRYAPGEPWRLPAWRAAIVLATAEDVFVCFDAKEVELLRARSPRARDARRALGPDLVTTRVSGAEILERAARLLPPDAPVVDLLLDQRVASGVGNVYKSEILFLERVHPLRALAALDVATAERLGSRAHELLRANTGGGPRTTRPIADGAGRLWVYRRAGKPCLRCGAPITTARLGRGRRSTYACPRCQPE